MMFPLIHGIVSSGGRRVIAASGTFNGTDADLSKNFGSAGNRNKWAFWTWLNVSSLGATRCPFSKFMNDAEFDEIRINTDGSLEVVMVPSTTYIAAKTAAGAVSINTWYALGITFDVSQALDVTIFIDGSDATATRTNEAAYSSYVNNTGTHYIGRRGHSSALSRFAGSMAQTAFFDGVNPNFAAGGDCLDASGNPKDISGLTFGTNGFVIDYLTSLAGWTNNNVTQSTDVPV